MMKNILNILYFNDLVNIAFQKSILVLVRFGYKIVQISSPYYIKNK